MRFRRVWRCLNLATGASAELWSEDAARRHLQKVAFLGEPDWDKAVEPYSLQTAMQVEVLGWLLRAPWQTLITVTDPE